MRTCVVIPPGKPAANKPRLRRLLTFLMDKATRGSGQCWGEVSLVISDDIGIREVNRLHLGHDDSTDVISYSFDPLPGQPPTEASGEIFINVERAQKVGKRFGGVNRELALYMAHGCDHLSGEDDSTPEKRRRMRQRELRWLEEASRLNLLTGLLAS
jgi:probable rRNA maturation factor